MTRGRQEVLLLAADVWPAPAVPMAAERGTGGGASTGSSSYQLTHVVLLTTALAQLPYSRPASAPWRGACGAGNSGVRMNGTPDPRPPDAAPVVGA
jgi:hypothetical protein